MSMTIDQTRHTDVPTSALLLFALITFAITWSILGGYIFLPEQMEATFGPISGAHPLYFIATWAPGIAGMTVVILFFGFDGLRRYLSRLFLRRVDRIWVLFILIGVPLVFMAGSLIKGGGLLVDLPPEGVGPVLALMGMMLFLGPVEELGWRGVAQPILQRHMAPLWAGVIIGAVWGFWHLPAFFLAGVVFAEWSFLPFFIGNITLAVLVTPIFNASRGSLLWPMVFHWQLNNPFWPDAQPWDTWILVVVAAVVVQLNRRTMLTRQTAVTQVVPGNKTAGQ